MNNDPERWRRYQEALQRAAQQGALSPEQMQMVQAAFQQMQQTGATQHSFTVTHHPDGTVVQQGGQPAGSSYGDPMKAPPTTMLPNQPPPSAVPQGYVDPLYQNALADLQRWLGQYEKYRMQGSFAQLEPIFQAIKQVTGR
ncbi:MAG TPA: hypothetical protein VKT82_08980 [Ktedonobacterales bacterium]|nr:hypothetical protein [Ktedonobacterales bacterium]